MSAAEYVIADPTGNITALVYTPVARPQQAETAEKIMAACRGCEQVGFFEEDGGETGLRMMGGEFCGNACMSFAAVTAARRDLGAAELAVKISGAPEPVPVSVRADGNGYRCTVSMPLPTGCGTVDFGRISAPVVRFPGIAHAVVTDRMPAAMARMLIREWSARVAADAFGIMLYDEKAGTLKPVVYVPSTDTVVEESSCASGTAAVGVWRAVKDGAGAQLSLREPAGELSVEAVYENGRVTGLALTGSVRIIGTGRLET